MAQERLVGESERDAPLHVCDSPVCVTAYPSVRRNKVYHLVGKHKRPKPRPPPPVYIDEEPRKGYNKWERKQLTAEVREKERSEEIKRLYAEDQEDPGENKIGGKGMVDPLPDALKNAEKLYVHTRTSNHHSNSCSIMRLSLLLSLVHKEQETVLSSRKRTKRPRLCRQQ